MSEIGRSRSIATGGVQDRRPACLGPAPGRRAAPGIRNGRQSTRAGYQPSLCVIKRTTVCCLKTTGLLILRKEATRKPGGQDEHPPRHTGRPRGPLAGKLAVITGARTAALGSRPDPPVRPGRRRGHPWPYATSARGAAAESPRFRAEPGPNAVLSTRWCGPSPRWPASPRSASSWATRGRPVAFPA